MTKPFHVAAAGQVKRPRSLLNESQRLSIMLSTGIVFAVLVCSLFAMIVLQVRALRLSSAVTADEMRDILAEPLYNIDDEQAIRIGEVLLSSGRVNGVRIESFATGVLMDRRSPSLPSLVETQERDIYHGDILLGRIVLWPEDGGVFAMVRAFSLTMVAIVIAITIANIAGVRYLVRRKVVGTFAGMVRGIERIGSGDYGTAIDATGYSDLDYLVSLMNGMAARIREKNAELVVANERLESRVAERTVELEASIAELRLLQERLIESGKLSALGQLSAGIAHELNTPLGAIVSSARSLAEFLDDHAVRCRAPDGFSERARALYEAVLAAAMEENRTLSVPLPSRKQSRETAEALAAAGVDRANDVAAALVDLGVASRVAELAPLLGTENDLAAIEAASSPAIARRMAAIVGESADKASRVVAALRSYLAPETAEESREVDIDGDIARVLTLMTNSLKHGVSVTTAFSGARTVGSSEKLSQVWMNLIRNAAQAMEFRGELEIRSELRGDSVVVSFRDNGPGIPPEIRERIFDPFFTTKKHGEGMGMGLDICRRIVEGHRGTIEVESSPGRTVFSVILPALSGNGR
jgi:signal transduction histidine kinase